MWYLSCYLFFGSNFLFFLFFSFLILVLKEEDLTNLLLRLLSFPSSSSKRRLRNTSHMSFIIAQYINNGGNVRLTKQWYHYLFTSLNSLPSLFSFTTTSRVLMSTRIRNCLFLLTKKKKSEFKRWNFVKRGRMKCERKEKEKEEGEKKEKESIVSLDFS